MKNNPLKFLDLSPAVRDGLLTSTRQLFSNQNDTFTGGKS
ncbi:hypothetical protein EDE11_108104 [Methylomonas methanica]|uniref:Uncharacterized protein n=1 Tax=Methylomonas methanica TaxID=421 RepID=A0ABY2CMS7_METMH|nr:hypothetical protein EDE11_108104 [Methylomonas methanica]